MEEQQVIVTHQEQNEEEQYLCEMNDIQRKTYNIAKEHLGTSFNLVKSNGFKEWKKQKQKHTK